MDTWDNAAARLEQQRTEAEAAQRQQARERTAEQERAHAAYLQRMAEREAICAGIIPQLTAFVNEHGASAQRLIQAYNPEHVIFIAGGKGGGGFWSVVFSVNGLEYIVGQGGIINERYSLSPEEAARKAIIDLGCSEPDKLVERLINSINYLVPQGY
jgi:hypothetical protein